MSATSESYDAVGPVLEAGELADAIVQAIRNENADVVVLDRGSYVRVLVPRKCSVTRDAIEGALGRPFRIPTDLEPVMPAFKGRLDMTTERATWYLRSLT